MAYDIVNSTGTADGNQNQGTIAVMFGDVITKNTKDAAIGSASHSGAFNNSKESLVSSIASKYDARFDDPGYYP